MERKFPTKKELLLVAFSVLALVLVFFHRVPAQTVVGEGDGTIVISSNTGGTYVIPIIVSGYDNNAPDTPLVATTTLTVNLTVTSSSLVISPTSTITTPLANVTFTASGGDGSYSWSTAGVGNPDTGNPSTGSGSSFTTSFGSVGNYTVTVKSGDGQTQSATVSVVPVPVSCNFDTSPISIIVPSTLTLSWSCTSDADNLSCNLNGASVQPVVLSKVVAPTQNTTYTLRCNNGVYGGFYSGTKTVNATTSAGIKEVPP